MRVTFTYQNNFRFAIRHIDALIPIAEYAKIHNVSPNTVRRRILRGRLLGLKSGGNWYVVHYG